MSYGTSFQVPTPPNSNPFLTPFQHLLDLDLNAPPLTRFPLPVSYRNTHRAFSNLLQTFKKLMTKFQLRILATDQSSGLVILNDTELQVFYSTYLLNFRQVPPSWYFSTVTKLRKLTFQFVVK